MEIQRLIRWLLPKEDHFYDMLEELGRLGHDAALEMQKFGREGHGGLAGHEVALAVQDIEHRADDVVRRMEEALARTFVTPLDREDLHRLTTELDNIVDLTNLTARASDVYHLERPTPAMVELMEKLVACTAIIKEAVPNLRTHKYDALLALGQKVRQVEKEADTIYRGALSALFNGPQIDHRELLKQKEALSDLEDAVDHCDAVAGLFANLAVKHA